MWKNVDQQLKPNHCDPNPAIQLEAVSSRQMPDWHRGIICSTSRLKLLNLYFHRERFNLPRQTPKPGWASAKSAKRASKLIDHSIPIHLIPRITPSERARQTRCGSDFADQRWKCYWQSSAVSVKAAASENLILTLGNWIIAFNSDKAQSWGPSWSHFSVHLSLCITNW